MNFFEVTFFDFDLWKLLLLSFGGLIAGFVSTIAGGGSLLTIPLLIFLGLPIQVANGTNRIAILLQNIMAVSRFSTKKVIKWEKALSLIIPSFIGGALGSFIATLLSKNLFDIVVGILMLFILLTLFIKPKKWEKKKEKIIEKWWRYPLFFVIGIYGGFIQIGVGFFLLTGLVFFIGFNIVSANALKVLVIMCYTVISLIIYAIGGQVVLVAGLFLGIGNTIGSFISVNSIFKIKMKNIKWIIVIAVLLTVAKLFGLLNFISDF